MKQLKNDPNIPPLVAHIWGLAYVQIPVGADMYEQAIKDHPEYFAREIEHRKKYNAIPQEVHDAYFKEISLVHDEIYKDLPGKGLMNWINRTEEEHKIWNEAYEKYESLEKKIHQKHYSKYGIKWSGF